MRLNWIDWIALVLTIIGALNWGLVAFGFNVVAAVFGTPPALGAVVSYILIALAGLWLIYLAYRLASARGFALNWIDWIALVLTIVGALNWGLVAFGVDIGGTIPPVPTLSVVVYILIGLSGLWLIYLAYRAAVSRAPVV